MTNLPNYTPLTDPSANTIQLVGNAKEYLEDLHNQAQLFNEQKLQLTRSFLEEKIQQSIEASRRERLMETERINMCRRDDNDAVKIAQLASEKRAEVLAAQMVLNADTLRAATTKQAETLQAAATKQAETLAAQLIQMTASLDNRLKIVEEKQYTIAGSSKGRNDMYGWISAGIVLVMGIVAFFIKK